jgi:lipoprotein
MKKFIYLFLLLALTGCNKPTANETPTSEIIEDIKSELNLTDAVEEDLTIQKNAEKYGISTNSIIDGNAYYSTSGNKSDKVILVRASSQSEVDNLEEALAAEKNASISAWKHIEGENEKTENSLLKTKDDCVILAICDKVDKIEEIFDKKL